MIFMAVSSTILANDKVDIIWIQKEKRQLHLIKNYKVTDTYPIALGKSSLGHKQREGDSRTPEGLYYIDGRNENSNFYLSLHISYPTPRDYRRAVRANVNPGNHIMIHGEPNDPKKKVALQTTVAYDWTNGCIALSNHNMQTLWDIVRTGTPVLIDP